jgi:hypothetical protein
LEIILSSNIVLHPIWWKRLLLTVWCPSWMPFPSLTPWKPERGDTILFFECKKELIPFLLLRCFTTIPLNKYTSAAYFLPSIVTDLPPSISSQRPGNYLRGFSSYVKICLASSPSPGMGGVPESIQPRLSSPNLASPPTRMAVIFFSLTICILFHHYQRLR